MTAVFPGKSKVASLMLTKDWSSSVLGDPDQWSLSLSSVVRLILNSEFPMFVAWGPQLGFLYNDAYALILGGKHPAALGGVFQEIWSEIWPDITPIIDSALKGESSYHEDLRLTIERGDSAEDAWFTFSYSPVYADDGTVGGMYCAVIETTRQVRDRQLRQFRLNLADKLIGLTSANDIVSNAVTMLGEHLGASGCWYAQIDDEKRTFHTKSGWFSPGQSAPPAVGSIDDFGPLLLPILRSGDALAISDLTIDSRFAEFAPRFKASDIRSILIVPLIKAGRLVYNINVIKPHVHEWSQDEVQAAVEVLDKTWTGLENALAQEALQSERGQSDDILNQINEGFLVVGTDLRVVRVNAEGLRLLGRAGADIIDRPFAEAWPSHVTDHVNKAAQQVLASQTAVRVELKVTRDGSDLFLELRVNPLADKGLAVFFIDITERKRAEEALQDETRILELLNQSGQSLASTLNLDTLLQTVTDSGRALTGAEFGAFFYNGTDKHGDAYLLYTLSGAPREAFDGFGHPRATPVFKPTFVGEPPIRSDDITQDPRYGRMGPHHGMPKGHLPVRSYLAAPVIGRTGEVIGGLFFGHSRTAVFNERSERLIIGLAAQAAIAIDNARLYDVAQKASEERQVLLAKERAARTEAEHLNRSKDEFLAMLAHELRNPLAPVRAAAELLKFSEQDPAKIRHVSEVIARQVGHLTHLIDDLMDVSRVTRGLVQINTEPLDVKDIITAAIEQVRPMVRGRRHSLTTQMDADSLFILGDRTRMIQVVANLLTNAVRYTPPQGEIKVQVSAGDHEVRIIVSDNGNGMDASLLPRVFELFTQGARGLDRTEGGLGIGLALVKAIVGLHKGEVWAESEGLGLGSTFTICIPRVQTPKQLESSSTVKIEGRSLSIMVVDDNTDAADVIAMLLEIAGHKVATAPSAIAALDLPDLEQFDVFLLDIGLPDMSGYDLARTLRSRPSLNNKAYLALTGYGQPQDRELSHAAGFAHHLVKPVDNQLLFKILAEIGAN